jgi:hypothetical protein
MDEAEIEARILIVLFCARSPAGGWLALDDVLDRGYEHLTPADMFAIELSAKNLARKGLIKFRPDDLTKTAVGLGQIDSLGVDYVKSRSSSEFPTLEEMLRPPIPGDPQIQMTGRSFASSSLGGQPTVSTPPLGVSASGETGGSPTPTSPPPLGVFATGQVGDLSTRVTSNANTGPFFLNQDDSADAAIRARELARRTVAGGAFEDSGFVPRPPYEIAADERKARMTAGILQRPAEVAESVRHLANELRSQVEAMQPDKPNDEEPLKRFTRLTLYFDESADKLDEIAENLETIAVTPNKETQRLLTGQAAEKFEKLGVAFKNWIDESDGKLSGKLFKVGIVTAVAVVLHNLNLDYLTNAGLLLFAYKILNESKSTKDK